MLKDSPKLNKAAARPRVGVPWRTVKQERNCDMRYNRDYLQAVRKAGGEPVQVSLQSPPHELENMAKTLDAIVLPGSPADVNPRKFGARPHPKTGKADLLRERTDSALLKHALAAGKPVLAICYGIQSLNVHLGGSLLQDVPSELRRPLVHSSRDHAKDAAHPVSIKSTDLAKLAGGSRVTVNSLHHQSVGRVGRGLRVIAHAPDGVIEAVEWTRGPGWALGVQWHPERMPGDPFAKNIFRRLVSEAASTPGRKRSAAKASRGRRATRATGKPLNRRGTSPRKARTGRRK